MRALRNVMAVIAGLAAMALVAPAGAAPGTAPHPGDDQFTLPAPTGRQWVGSDALHLVDADRPDPWVPTGPRELMVSVWYPAAVPGGHRVPYATAEESALVLAGIPVPADALTRVRIHARVGVPPLRTPHRLPLVVLSPGFGLPRWTLTALAEDLASRGYVVAGVDHTYEAAAVTFPDGRVAECVVCTGEVNGPEIAASRTLDLSFVLDRLLGHRRYGQLIDPRRIAAAGHSIGGAAAAATMLADRRVDAGINLDGSFQPALQTGLSRPFLMLGAGARHGLPGQDASWDATWPHLTGWRRWLHAPEMEHSSVTDIAVWGDWVGLPVQPLPGARCVEIIRSYVAAFVDRHPRHQPEPLLNGPSPQFPEIDFMGPTV
ncbi:MAG TPA: alpha/beta hydrolase [Actinophytocola sp.]|uniref:alpha/beta hydrolase family protein n=1 Tax=Actinophytocola sp. TaxID=1872138 RepID=UPI002DDD03CC|nr:alpha/beta hydrolase [Actinophytocola sp.]HEV2779256.1 alpha/beta hydrolase [Actinophytocola sp.]